MDFSEIPHQVSLTVNLLPTRLVWLDKLPWLLLCVYVHCVLVESHTTKGLIARAISARMIVFGNYLCNKHALMGLIKEIN